MIMIAITQENIGRLMKKDDMFLFFYLWRKRSFLNYFTILGLGFILSGHGLILAG